MTSNIIFNKSGLLTMTAFEREQYFTSAIGQFIELGNTAARKSQYNEYSAFIKRILKVDIETNPELDPFTGVTGYPLRTFLLDKFKSGNEGINVTLAQTDFISATEILPMGLFSNPKKRVPRKIKKLLKQKPVPSLPESEDDDYEHMWGEKITTKKFTAFVCYRLIGPILINTEKNWHLNFSFCDISAHTHAKTKKRIHIFKGVIVLEPEPLEKIRHSKNFQKIYDMLVEVGTWFNHDMTGHATLDFYAEAPEGTGAHGVSLKNLASFEQPYWNIRMLLRSKPKWFYNSIWFEERRRESQQFELIEACIQKRPALKKYILKHLRSFAKLLNSAQIECCLSTAEVEYFLGVYMFCLARVLRFDDLLKISDQAGVFESLCRYLGYNRNEEIILKDIHKKFRGVPYVYRDEYTSGEIFMEDLCFTPHTTFYKTIHARLFSEAHI